MADLMEKWTGFATDDETVQGILVVGDVRISGTDRRITWRAKATTARR